MRSEVFLSMQAKLKIDRSTFYKFEKFRKVAFIVCLTDLVVCFYGIIAW